MSIWYDLRCYLNDVIGAAWSYRTASLPRAPRANSGRGWWGVLDRRLSEICYRQICKVHLMETRAVAIISSCICYGWEDSLHSVFGCKEHSLGGRGCLCFVVLDIARSGGDTRCSVGSSILSWYSRREHRHITVG